MHDPDVVAFDVRLPIPTRCKRFGSKPGVAWRWHWPYVEVAHRKFYFGRVLVIVWHREPGGADSGTVCRNWKAARWHVWHWHLQFPPLQDARRRLLTRCEWCAGRSGRRLDCVNVSHNWNRKPGHWWRGERGLYHHDCSFVHNAWSTCTCEAPVLEHDTFGRCARCNRSRGYGASHHWLVTAALLREAIPEHARRPDVYSTVMTRTAVLKESTT